MNANSALSRAIEQPSATVQALPLPSIPVLPLVVDLDGTLIKTDLLQESVCGLMRQAPLALFALPVWLLKGRAHLKREIAQRVEVNDQRKYGNAW